MTVFTFTEPDAPHAIVIGPSHPPYYVFADGRTEEVSPEAED